MIQLADTKADIIMAASAILAGLLVPEAVHASSAAARDVLVAAIALALGSAGTALAAVFPRTSHKKHSSLLYYVAIDGFKSSAEFYAKLKTLNATQSDEELAQETWELSHIQKKKYAWLRVSVAGFVLCLLLTLIGVVLAMLLAPLP
jgi:hypothetical protein